MPPAWTRLRLTYESIVESRWFLLSELARFTFAMK